MQVSRIDSSVSVSSFHSLRIVATMDQCVCREPLTACVRALEIISFRLVKDTLCRTIQRRIPHIATYRQDAESTDSSRTCGLAMSASPSTYMIQSKRGSASSSANSLDHGAGLRGENLPVFPLLSFSLSVCLSSREATRVTRASPEPLETTRESASDSCPIPRESARVERGDHESSPLSASPHRGAAV